MKEYFTEFGDLLTCKLMKHADGKSRGFAFIRFETKETQEKVSGQ